MKWEPAVVHHPAAETSGSVIVKPTPDGYWCVFLATPAGLVDTGYDAETISAAKDLATQHYADQMEIGE